MSSETQKPSPLSIDTSIEVQGEITQHYCVEGICIPYIYIRIYTPSLHFVCEIIFDGSYFYNKL